MSNQTIHTDDYDYDDDSTTSDTPTIVQLSPDSEEWQEAYECMKADLDSGECVIINHKDEVSFCGTRLGRIGHSLSWETVWAEIEQECVRQQFWPSIYRISDHGNVTLVDRQGNEIAAWV